MPLPAGLDPVSAGRFGLWLLGKRASAARQRRIPFPRRVARGHAGPVAATVWPWHVHQYPGAAVMLSAICGVSLGTARHWLKGSRMSPRNRERLAQWLEDQAAILQSLALELRRDVAAARKPSDNFRKRENGPTAEIITSAPQEQAPVIAKAKAPASPKKVTAENIRHRTKRPAKEIAEKSPPVIAAARPIPQRRTVAARSSGKPAERGKHPKVST